METFKAWKELIKAVKGISSAIEGGNSGGEVDNTNYIDEENLLLFNKNLDNTKLAFDTSTGPAIIQKVGDLFNQEGVDIINSMLPILVDNKNKICKVYVFIKDSHTGNVAANFITLTYEARMDEFVMREGAYVGRVSDKFTLDTPMSKGGIA